LTNFEAVYITVVEDISILSAKYYLPAVPIFYFWRKL